jgi:hypothetical protein
MAGHGAFPVRINVHTVFLTYSTGPTYRCLAENASIQTSAWTSSSIRVEDRRFFGI